MPLIINKNAMIWTDNSIKWSEIISLTDFSLEHTLLYIQTAKHGEIPLKGTLPSNQPIRSQDSWRSNAIGCKTLHNKRLDGRTDRQKELQTQPLVTLLFAENNTEMSLIVVRSLYPDSGDN